MDFSEKDVAADLLALAEMRSLTGKSFVPQIFIGDEYIGGYQDFLILDARGEIDRKLGRRPHPVREVAEIFDMIIIGGGPAGLTAAVYAARKGMKTLLLADLLGGQPILTADVENYMGFQFVTGPELMAKFEEQVRQFPNVVLITGQPVTRLELEGGLKKATTASEKSFLGRSVIIASGKQPRMLNIPGEREYVGRGVSYCATCDVPLCAGESVMVAGGGNSAMEAALELSAICPHVHLVVRDRLRGDEVLMGKVLAEDRICKHLSWQPAEIKGDGKEVKSVAIASADGKDRKEIDVRAFFVEAGLHPNADFAVGLVQLNPLGEIIVDCDCRTGVDGVFAAGDVTQVRDKQIVVAAGEGAKAALSAYEYLLVQR